MPLRDSANSRVLIVALCASSMAGHAVVAGSCTGDLDGDGTVGGADLGLVLSGWGQAGGDLNGDATTDGADLGVLIGSWGACPVIEEWTLITRLDAVPTTAFDGDWVTSGTWTGTGVGASIAYLRPDGGVVRPSAYANGTNFNAGGRGGRIQIWDSAGTLTNTLIIATSAMQHHHDIALMPNGNILAIVWDLRAAAQAQAAGRTGITTPMWSEMILELRPTGTTTYEVVWQWKLWDHLIQDANAALANYGVVGDHPELVDINAGTVATTGDWIHMNAIDYSPTRDEIVVSSRTLSELWVIDHSTTTAQAATHAGGQRGRGGDLLYRWGNPALYDRGTAADQHFFVVHSVNWIDDGLPGAGNILAFNNGDRAGAANDYSTVVELLPPRTSDGAYIQPSAGAYQPSVPTWSVGGPGQWYGGATQCGAMRTLDNTTLITLTNSGTVFEVDAAGTTLNTRSVTGQVARAVRYRKVNGAWVGP